MNYLDLLGSIFSFMSTALCMTASILTWPLGILATITNGTLFFQKGIYGDMCLEIIYLFAMIYGWYTWQYGDNKKPMPISYMSMRQAKTVLFCGLTAIPCLALILKYQLHSQVAWIDAFTTVVSLLAMWLSCLKVIESWVLWFTIDATSVILCSIKGLPVHIILYSVYLVMAVFGYYRWVKMYKGEMENSSFVPDLG